MKVGILGTRGIPNHYGGFEQFAEYFSSRLVNRGIEVWVYNSHNHPYQKQEWNGVHIVHCYDPEYLVGPVGPFIYDLNCILDSRNRNFDVILQLGYASSSIWHRLLPEESIVVTNMDGLEWSRSKYNPVLKSFIRHAEKMAVRNSDLLVADSSRIRDYFKTTYNASSVYIPYGAEILHKPDEKLLHPFGLEPENYYLAISRIQSDNNTEVIVRGFLESGTDRQLVLIGSMNNKYGRYLKEKYKSAKIVMLGGLFDVHLLNQFRYHSRLYFHGHSSGGTNPSLLEAMASQALICAHNNPFNRSTLGPDGFFFENEHQVSRLIVSDPHRNEHGVFLSNNLKKIEVDYQWEKITDDYVEVFRNLMQKK